MADSNVIYVTSLTSWLALRHENTAIYGRFRCHLCDKSNKLVSLKTHENRYYLRAAGCVY